MDKHDPFLQYCMDENWCYSCFKEDPQDPVKLFLNLCHICHRDRWYSHVRFRISTEDLRMHIKMAPKEWLHLYQEELKLRS
jgi:hypothetical protein